MCNRWEDSEHGFCSFLLQAALPLAKPLQLKPSIANVVRDADGIADVFQPTGPLQFRVRNGRLGTWFCVLKLRICGARAHENNSR